MTDPRPVAVLCLAALVLGAAPLAHTDFWGHLRYGEVIAATGRCPDRDPLTPFATDPVAPSAWLCQLGYHLLMRLGGSVEGGVEAVRLAHLLAAVLFLGLVGLALRRSGATPGWTAAGLALTFALMPGSLAVQRPQLVALPLFAAVLAVVSRPDRAVWALPAIFAVWANLHGSFPAGLLLLGLSAAGRRDRRLALAFALSVVAACLHPRGPLVYLDAVRFARHPNLATLAEWQPLHFTLGPGGHRAYLLSLVLVLAGRLWSRRRLAWAELAVLPFAVFPLLQQRTFVWWAPLAVWLAVPRGDPPPAETPARRRVVSLALVGLTVLGSPAARWLVNGPRPLAAAVHPDTPLDLPPLPPGPVFASETLGDFLAWRTPDRPVLLTNHAHAFAPDHWRACLRVKAAEPGWDEQLRAFGATAVVVERASHPALTAALAASPGWQLVGDPAGRRAVAVRR